MTLRVWPLLVAAMVGCETRELRVQAVVELEGDAVSGEEVYDEHCASCHGVGGSGGMTIGQISAEEMAEQILAGGSSTVYAYMPPFEATLEDQQIADVIAYLMDRSM
jgi:mono/diheme cytochrome c family protein